jgi:transcriptional regulator with XRE-family HTH domain
MVCRSANEPQAIGEARSHAAGKSAGVFGARSLNASQPIRPSNPGVSGVHGSARIPAAAGLSPSGSNAAGPIAGGPSGGRRWCGAASSTAAGHPADRPNTTASYAVASSTPESGPPASRESADAVLAKNLVAARVIAGITQRELADAAGISRATVAQIETGSSDPRLSTIVELARALGLPPAALLFGEPEVRALVALPDHAGNQPDIDPRDTARMRHYLASGMLKDRLRAARVGANAVESTARSPLGPILAALFSAVIPGTGTRIGSLFGDLLANAR